MGLFSGIRNTYKKSEAAVVLQNIFELHSPFHLPSGTLVDPAKFATVLVENVWKTAPEVFSGKFGRRPHKLTLAISAAANALKGALERNRHDAEVTGVLAVTLGTLLSEVDNNGSFYAFNSADEKLLSLAVPVMERAIEELDDAVGDELLTDQPPERRLS